MLRGNTSPRFTAKGKRRSAKKSWKKVYFLFSFVFLRTGFENEHKHSNWKRVRIRDSKRTDPKRDSKNSPNGLRRNLIGVGLRKDYLKHFKGTSKSLWRQLFENWREFRQRYYKNNTKWLRGDYNWAAKWLRGGYKLATKWLQGDYKWDTKWLRGGYKWATKRLREDYKWAASRQQMGYKVDARRLQMGYKVAATNGFDFKGKPSCNSKGTQRGPHRDFIRTKK